MYNREDQGCDDGRETEHGDRCGCPGCDPDSAADMEAELLAGQSDR